MAQQQPVSPETVVATSPTHLALIIVPLAVAAGVILGLLADWAVSLPWVPLEGPFRLVQQIPPPLDVVLPAGVGLVGGVVVWMLALEDRIVVRVSDHRIEVRRKSFVRELPRQRVGAALLDGKQLVVLDRHHAERLRVRIDNDDREALEKAFRAHGYEFADSDPYHDQFRRWVPAMPELPTGADALLRARAQALDKGDDVELAELHGELGRLGVAVREEGKRQYWRSQSGERDAP